MTNRVKNIKAAMHRTHYLREVLKRFPAGIDYCRLPGPVGFPHKVIFYPCLDYDLPFNKPSFELSFAGKELIHVLNKQGFSVFYITDLGQNYQFMSWAENQILNKS